MCQVRVFHKWVRWKLWVSVLNLCFSTYVSAFGFVGFMLFFLMNRKPINLVVRKRITWQPVPWQFFSTARNWVPEKRPLPAPPCGIWVPARWKRRRWGPKGFGLAFWMEIWSTKIRWVRSVKKIVGKIWYSKHMIWCLHLNRWNKAGQVAEQIWDYPTRSKKYNEVPPRETLPNLLRPESNWEGRKSYGLFWFQRNSPYMGLRVTGCCPKIPNIILTWILLRSFVLLRSTYVDFTGIVGVAEIALSHWAISKVLVKHLYFDRFWCTFCDGYQHWVVGINI